MLDNVIKLLFFLVFLFVCVRLNIFYLGYARLALPINYRQP